MGGGGQWRNHPSHGGGRKGAASVFKEQSSAARMGQPVMRHVEARGQTWWLCSLGIRRWPLWVGPGHAGESTP